MNRFEKCRALLVLSLAFCASGFAQAPRLFFTDLTSGPNSGGESVSSYSGAYVTLYGNYFGSSQGSSTVTLNGANCLRVVSWGTTWLWYQKIVIQLGSSCSTGHFSIAVNGQASTNAAIALNGSTVDPSLFTVRSGHIYCVSNSGADSNAGTFSAGCWQTMAKAIHTMAAGDISYVESGVQQTATDNYNADLAIASGGTSILNPISLIAYPSASVVAGTNSVAYGVRTPQTSGTKSYWVVGGISLRGIAALDLAYVDGWRVIANDFSCPQGSGESACFHTDTTTNLAFYGNYVHNIGDQAGSIDKYYHAVYFSTNSNHIDVGWDTVIPNPTHSTSQGGCRAIQFYSTGGSDQFDLHVHDNLVHDAICDGINFATVNADNGAVEAYNNVVYHAGTGPDPADGAANYTCVNAGTSGSPANSIEIYNNTFYDCGSRGTSGGGAFSLYAATRLRNNITYQLSGESYLASEAGGSSLSGFNNEWFGLGNGPSQTTQSVNADPKFTSTSAPDFHLQSGSPAINSSTAVTTLTGDHDGVVRPQGTGYDIGAYEFFTGGSTRPNPPTGLSATVN